VAIAYPPPTNVDFLSNFAGHKTEWPFHSPANLAEAQPTDG
jgi:hypothetical protein